MTSTQVPAGDLCGPHADPGYDHVKTTAELFTDWYFQQAAHVRGASHDGPARTGSSSAPRLQPSPDAIRAVLRLVPSERADGSRQPRAELGLQLA